MHADAHVLARAKLGEVELARINAGLKDSINAMQYEEASFRSKQRRGAASAEMTPPTNNMGGKVELRLENGKVKQVLPRTHYAARHCFIDWVGFTVHEDVFQIIGHAVTDDEIIMAASLACESIFGFGITSKNEKGKNFYKSSYVLGEGWGFVLYGGQRNTVHILLSGEGCAAARVGWERRLYDFLDSSHGHITRIDLSHDDIKGELYTMEDLDAAYDEGLFSNGGRTPDIEHRGNWKSPNGKGRTLYVGHRSNGRYFRGYEKGKQLGDPDSPWVRLEVELKSVDRIIPLDILKYPQDYFAAAYPILARFSKEPQRIHTIQKTTQISYDRTKKWLKRQCGAAINLMLNVEGNAERVLQLIIREGKIPRGIMPPSFRNVGQALHHFPRDFAPMAISTPA